MEAIEAILYNKIHFCVPRKTYDSTASNSQEILLTGISNSAFSFMVCVCVCVWREEAMYMVHRKLKAPFGPLFFGVLEPCASVQGIDASFRQPQKHSFKKAV